MNVIGRGLLRLAAILISVTASGYGWAKSCPKPKDQGEPHFRESAFDTLEGWGEHFSYPHSVKLVADPHKSDNQVARVELREGDVYQTRSGPAYRAEVYERYRAEFNQPMHYRFRAMVAKEWQFDDVRALIAQWHGTPDLHLGEISRSPNLGIELRKDRFLIRGQWSSERVNTHNKIGMQRQKYYLSDPIDKDRWYQFDVQVIWTHNQNGYLKIRIDDELVVNYSGPTSYNDCQGPYFKMGIYRDNTPNTFVIYFDDYKRQLISD